MIEDIPIPRFLLIQTYASPNEFRRKSIGGIDGRRATYFGLHFLSDITLEF